MNNADDWIKNANSGGFGSFSHRRIQENFLLLFGQSTLDNLIRSPDYSCLDYQAHRTVRRHFASAKPNILPFDISKAMRSNTNSQISLQSTKSKTSTRCRVFSYVSSTIFTSLDQKECSSPQIAGKKAIRNHPWNAAILLFTTYQKFR